MKTGIKSSKKNQQPQASKDRRRIPQIKNKPQHAEKKEKSIWNPSALYF